MRTLLTTLASVLLLLAGSCTSPLAGLKVGSTTLPPVGPDENRLVFHFPSSAKAVDPNYTMNDVGYLVVQLRSKYQQSAKFASAPVVAGVATVSFNGLVAGPWEIMASCYDWDGDTIGSSIAGSPTSTQPYLLYTGQDQLMITPGSTTNVSLLFYKPGDISVTGAPASYVTSLSLLDNQTPPQAGPSTLKVGDDLTLFAHATDSGGNTLNVEQRVYWFSSDPSVLEVANAPKNDGGDDSYTGTTSTKVYAKKPGHAFVYATSIELPLTGIQASDMYEVWVDPPYLGMWKMTSTNDNSSSVGEIYLKISRDPTTKQLLWERTKGANTGTMVEKDRGNVTVNGDASITLDYKQYFDTDTTSSTSGTWQNYPRPTYSVPSPISVNIGNGIYTFTEMVSAMTRSYTFGLMGTGGLPAYVPSTALTVAFQTKPYSGSYVLGDELLTAAHTGPVPTIKTVLWFTNPSPANVGNFSNSNYTHSPGTALQFLYNNTGTVTFRAVSLDDTSVVANLTSVTVLPNPMFISVKDPLSNTSGTLSLAGPNTVQLTASWSSSVPNFTPTTPLSVVFTWTSSNSSLASVGSNGLVTAIANSNSVNITALPSSLEPWMTCVPYVVNLTP